MTVSPPGTSSFENVAFAALVKRRHEDLTKRGQSARA